MLHYQDRHKETLIDANNCLKVSFERLVKCSNRIFLKSYYYYCYYFFFTYFCFPASGQSVVTGVVPFSPRFLPSIFVAHRGQQSPARRFFIEC